MTRLQKARQFVNEPWAADWIGTARWQWLLGNVWRREHEVYASLLLDGYPARCPRFGIPWVTNRNVCRGCLTNLGHNRTDVIEARTRQPRPRRGRP